MRYIPEPLLTETEDMKHFFAALIAISLPASLSAASLSEVLDNYVTSFDVTELTEGARDEITTIHSRDDLAHGMKVLLVHDVLLKADALEHANMHSATPQPFQLSSAD